MEYLDELKKLNLPQKGYAITGSGPLVIRGYRGYNSDIDIVVKPELWDKLREKYADDLIAFENGEELIKVGNIEISKNWFGLFNLDQLINDADMVQDLPFVKLTDTLKTKNFLNRDKDQTDIKVLRGVLYHEYDKPNPNMFLGWR